MSTQPTETDRSEEFTTFMHAYQDMVYSTADRLVGDDAQAEDIAQEVFVRAYERFAELRKSSSAGGWLKTVATNLSLNHLSRYRKRWRMFSELHADDDDAHESPAFMAQSPDTLLADLDAEQRRALIDSALRRLPEHQRLPLALYHFEDFSYEEIASRLGVSLAKVKTDIRRGRAALLPLLAGSGIAPDSLRDR